MAELTEHLVFVVDDDDFLQALREEECGFDDFMGYVEDGAPLALRTSASLEIDVPRVVEIFGLTWTESTEVEDLDGTVVWLEANEVDAALARVEANVSDAHGAARRLASILSEEFDSPCADDEIERAAEFFTDDDPEAEPADDVAIEAMAQIIVQQLHALRSAADGGFAVVGCSYLE